MLLKKEDFHKNKFRLQKGNYTMSKVAKELGTDRQYIHYIMKGNIIKPGNRIEEGIVKIINNCPEL